VIVLTPGGSLFRAARPVHRRRRSGRRSKQPPNSVGECQSRRPWLLRNGSVSSEPAASVSSRRLGHISLLLTFVSGATYNSSCIAGLLWCVLASRRGVHNFGQSLHSHARSRLVGRISFGHAPAVQFVSIYGLLSTQAPIATQPLNTSTELRHRGVLDWAHFSHAQSRRLGHISLLLAFVSGATYNSSCIAGLLWCALASRRGIHNFGQSLHSHARSRLVGRISFDACTRCAISVSI
jgi:hypothetical protein